MTLYLWLSASEFTAGIVAATAAAARGWAGARIAAEPSDSVRYHLDLTPELLLRPAFHQANER